MMPELPTELIKPELVEKEPVRSPPEFVKLGPVEVVFRLEVGVWLGGADVVELEDGLMIPLLPVLPIDEMGTLKLPVRSPPEFVKLGPVEVMFRLEVGVWLGGADVVELDGLMMPLLPVPPIDEMGTLKLPVRSPPEFVKLGPVEVVFRLEVGVWLGGADVVELEDGLMIPLLPVPPIDETDTSILPERPPPADQVKGGPVDVLLFELGGEVTIGGMRPLAPVEETTAVLR